MNGLGTSSTLVLYTDCLITKHVYPQIYLNIYFFFTDNKETLVNKLTFQFLTVIQL